MRSNFAIRRSSGDAQNPAAATFQPFFAFLTFLQPAHHHLRNDQRVKFTDDVWLVIALHSYRDADPGTVLTRLETMTLLSLNTANLLQLIHSTVDKDFK